MATQKEDTLDALQLIFDDALVQTGKAMRASRKDVKGNTAQAPGSVHSKLPDTLSSFHSTLDKLENDIVRAKSVLLRDLNELRARKMPVQQPQPQPVEIEAQSKSPMVIDLDSSPPPFEDQSLPIKAESKPMAPFPDMGTDLLPEAPPPDALMKGDSTPLQQDFSLDSDFNTDYGTPAAPMPEQKVEEHQSAFSGADVPSGMPAPAPGSNFTDMQFDLAPASNDIPAQSTSVQEPSFDLTTFAPADANDNMLDMDAFLPLNDQPNPPVMSGQEIPTANEIQGQAADKPVADTSATFNDMFNNSGGSPADGMDFDFGLDGGGMGEDTFDDLIQDRDDNFNTMEHGEFDATFFGLDAPNDT